MTDGKTKDKAKKGVRRIHRGVRDPRPKHEERDKLALPRRSPNRDLIAVGRRQLRGPAEERVKQALIEKRNGGPSPGGRGRLTMAPYRYTRETEIVNEEMGFGERIRETYWQMKEDRSGLEESERVSQRTKTGRQHLYMKKDGCSPDENDGDNEDDWDVKGDGDVKGPARVKAPGRENDVSEVKDPRAAKSDSAVMSDRAVMSDGVVTSDGAVMSDSPAKGDGNGTK